MSEIFREDAGTPVQQLSTKQYEGLREVYGPIIVIEGISDVS